jgi:hypothetical protein
MTPAVAVADWVEDLEVAADRSVSPEARRARRGRRPIDRDGTPSVSVDEAYDRSLQALREAADEAARPGWDGHGGQPVSRVTVSQALTFLDLLPSRLPGPDISAHPDGELAFEWFRGPRRLLTVSVNESGRLSYAALFGPARQHGTEFLVDTLPDSIAQAFRRLYSLG